MFFNGRFEEAAGAALNVRSSNPDNLTAYELRSTALLFQMKRLLGTPRDREQAWKACAACQQLFTEFLSETTHGRTRARARLQANPGDEDALFVLGKLNLNYVWFQLGTLGRKTGWSEYREARRSLDTLLHRNPDHVRARVARACIDYIVDTKVPWAVRWAFGGADKDHAMRSVLDVAQGGGDFFDQAEAGFALWEMQIREKNIADAIATARGLSRDFPENRELTKFLSAHDLTGTR